MMLKDVTLQIALHCLNHGQNSDLFSIANSFWAKGKELLDTFVSFVSSALYL